MSDSTTMIWPITFTWDEIGPLAEIGCIACFVMYGMWYFGGSLSFVLTVLCLNISCTFDSKGYDPA